MNPEPANPDAIHPPLDAETAAALERLRQQAAAREAVHTATKRINDRQKRKQSGGKWWMGQTRRHAAKPSNCNQLPPGDR